MTLDVREAEKLSRAGRTSSGTQAAYLISEEYPRKSINHRRLSQYQSVGLTGRPTLVALRLREAGLQATRQTGKRMMFGITSSTMLENYNLKCFKIY
jgi:hypothetical protein